MTISNNLGSNGLAISVNQTTEISSLASIDTKTPTLVSGRQPVDGSGVTQPISAVSLPLSSGAATSALQTTGNISVASIDGKIVTVNTGAVVVSSSALPSGASTSANQTTTNTLLNGGLPAALGVGGGLKIDGSGTILPVSGIVAVSNSFALDATLSTFSGKFPSTASLADAASNPSLSNLGSYSFSFNGTTWDRVRSAVVGPTSTLTGLLNSIPVGQFNSSAPTLTNGQIGALQLTSSGLLKVNVVSDDSTNSVSQVVQKPLTTSTYTYSLYSNYAASANQNVKASSGNVYSVMCRNTNGAVRFAQLHNTTTTPAGGAIPLISIPVPQNSTAVIGTDFFGPNGLNFSTGIAFAFSTTSGTFTAGAAGDQTTFINYK